MLSKFRRSQQGLSLVELMISVLLGAMLLFGVFQIFESNRQTSRMANAYSRVQESGRIGLEMIAREVRMAGFWGCAPDTLSITNHLDTADSDYRAWMNPSGALGVSGGDNVAAATSIGGVTVKEFSDTITLRGVRGLNDAKVISPYMPTPSAVVRLAVNNGISLGDIIIISDCTGADVFTNTQNDTDATGVLQHNTGNMGSFVNNATQPLSHTYDGTAQLTVPYQITYFVGENADGSTSLYHNLNGVNAELVRNVDDLQFIYGEDTNDDGSADILVTAGVVGDMDLVVSVQVTITAASTENVVNGNPLNRVYSTTANIRNRTL